MMLKHWKECSQDIIPMDLQYGGVYIINAQAWHLKGYLGGKHTWLAFKDKEWMVAELTTRETLNEQDAAILYDGAFANDDHGPFISTREPNRQWFGHDPHVVWIHPYTIDRQQVFDVCKQYPIKEFKLLSQNCNTFISYLVWRLNIDMRGRKNYGYKSIGWWNDRYPDLGVL